MNTKKMFCFMGLLVCVLFLFSSCNKPVKQAERADFPKELKPVDYLPLNVGNSWTYEVRQFFIDGKAPKESSLLTKVIDNKNGEASVLSGDQIIKYKIKDSGIFKLSSKTLLIPQPINKDAEWDINIAGIHGKGKILSTSEKVITPTGLFENCLLIEERYSEDDLIIHYAYAPKVGLVRIEEYVIMDKKEFLHLQASLRIYTVQ